MKSLEERRADRKADEKERLKNEARDILGGNAPGDDGSKDGVDTSAAGKGEGAIGKANADAAKKAGSAAGASGGGGSGATGGGGSGATGGAASGNGGGSGFTGKPAS